jgi:hypothetical protein
MFKRGQKVWVQVGKRWIKATIRGPLPDGWFINGQPPAEGSSHFLLDLDDPDATIQLQDDCQAWAEEESKIVPREDVIEDQFGYNAPNTKIRWEDSPWRPNNVSS